MMVPSVKDPLAGFLCGLRAFRVLGLVPLTCSTGVRRAHRQTIPRQRALSSGTEGIHSAFVTPFTGLDPMCDGRPTSPASDQPGAHPAGGPSGVPDLRELVSAASLRLLPRILAALEAARADAWARLLTCTTAADPTREVADEDRLLTIGEVAERLAVRVDYAYALARQGKLPAVRLPGLEKGGRQRDGKQIRVRADALSEWIRALGR
jgi:excisionase family DNA binding protein